jgi:RimJ/RimL family protein N-acetyltransferase
MNLHRIYCATTADNVAMQNLAISVGMKKEGRRREAAFKDNRYIDVMEYGLLRNKMKRR